jgi:dsRNA-specific ribonuclease
VSIDGKTLGSGQGRSKKLAETQAAIDALSKLPKPKKSK